MGALAALERDRGRLYWRARGEPSGAAKVSAGGALVALRRALLRALFHRHRILARTDSNETTLFYSNIVGALALLPVVPLVWTTPSDPLVIALMVATGAVGSFGHYLLIAAHRLAPAPFCRRSSIRKSCW